MIPEKKNYVYGSAAPKIEYNVYEENKVLKQKKKQRVNNKLKLKVVFTIITFFAAFFQIIFMYAQITEVNYELSELNKKYSDVKNGNIQLKLEIQKSTDLNRIKEVAETRLDMQKPDKYQIVYVKVPKKDVTKIAAIDKQESAAPGVPALVSDMFNNIAKFFD